MPHKRNAVSNEAVTIQSQSFFHPGVSYNPDKNEVSFSDEAKIALQNLVTEIQSHFPAEPIDSILEHHQTEKVTLAVADNVADAMIIDGKGKKAIKRFLGRAIGLLEKKKVGGRKIEEKVQAKVHKYNDTIFAHIAIQYLDGDETKSLHDTPIIIRPGEDIDTMFKSLKTRLRFSGMKK